MMAGWRATWWRMNLGILGKVALVMGGGRGIGRAD